MASPARNEQVLNPLMSLVGQEASAAALATAMASTEVKVHIKRLLEEAGCFGLSTLNTPNSRERANKLDQRGVTKPTIIVTKST